MVDPPRTGQLWCELSARVALAAPATPSRALLAASEPIGLGQLGRCPSERTQAGPP